MTYTTALSEISNRYAIEERRTRASRPHLPGATRHRVASRLRRVADRLDG